VQIVHASSTFEGSLHTDRDVRVDGVVRGKVESAGRVVIGANGRVEGGVTAGLVEVHGRVEGWLLARERLTVHPGGVVEGDLFYENIHVADGAIIRGQATHLLEEAVVELTRLRQPSKRPSVPHRPLPPPMGLPEVNGRNDPATRRHARDESISTERADNTQRYETQGSASLH
jgi:cytoskeletal protein CcmA (bactofilin family)